MFRQGEPRITIITTVIVASQESLLLSSSDDASFLACDGAFPECSNERAEGYFKTGHHQGDLGGMLDVP